MPKFLEKILEHGAAKKGYTGRQAAGYVYGALNNMGAMHGNQETAKGAAMQKKHEAAAATPPKKKKLPKPLHERMAKAMSTPAPGANYEEQGGGY